MAEVDARLIKLVRQLDQERQARLKAERQVRGYEPQFAVARGRLLSLRTSDAKLTPE